MIATIRMCRLLILAPLALPAGVDAQGPLDLDAVAVAGEPFGVGQIQFMTPPGVRATRKRSRVWAPASAVLESSTREGFSSEWV